MKVLVSVCIRKLEGIRMKEGRYWYSLAVDIWTARINLFCPPYMQAIKT